MVSMEKITLNGQRYISLAEFNHERRNLVKDVYDRCEHDDEGKIILSERDSGYIQALYDIMNVVMYEEIHDAETPDEIRAMHRKLDSEYALHRYIIVGKDEEDGMEVYFRKYCDCVEDGELTPVFTTMKRLAKAWTDYHEALVICNGLLDTTGDETLEVVAAWTRLLPAGTAEKRLLNAIFGEDKEKDDEG